MKLLGHFSELEVRDENAGLSSSSIFLQRVISTGWVSCHTSGRKFYALYVWWPLVIVELYPQSVGLLESGFSSCRDDLTVQIRFHSTERWSCVCSSSRVKLGRGINEKSRGRIYLLRTVSWPSPWLQVCAVQLESHWAVSRSQSKHLESPGRCVAFCKKTHSEEPATRKLRIHNRSSSRKFISRALPWSRARHCYGFGSCSRFGFVLFYINL